MLVYKLAAKKCLGILFEYHRIFRPIGPQLSIDEPRLLRRLLEEAENGMAFYLTSSPLEDDIHELFEEELNPVSAENPRQSRLFLFLADLWSMPNLVGMDVILTDQTIVREEELAVHEKSFEEFVSHVADYYTINLNTNSKGAVGLFRISKRATSETTRES